MALAPRRQHVARRPEEAPREKTLFEIIYIIQLTPHKLSAEQNNGAGAEAPARGQKTRRGTEGNEPGRRRYREVLNSEG